MICDIIYAVIWYKGWSDIWHGMIRRDIWCDTELYDVYIIW